MTVSTKAIQILRYAGEQPDDGIDLAETALALAWLNKPEMAMEPYRSHLQGLVEQVREEGPATKLDDRLRLLRRVLVVQNKYRGNDSITEDSRNADLMHVIDCRQGSAVALGIIFLHVAEKVGWPMTGLGFPGHFFVRLSAMDGRAILDPYRSGQTCSPDDLRALVVAGTVEAMERLPDYYTPLSKREILLRLLNNIKRRQLGADQAEAAAITLQSMILIAPQRHDLWRELGYMQADRGNLRSAITALEIVSDLTRESAQAQQAKELVQQLRRQLN